MKLNGLLIDCSRLMEQHDYYFRLIDFMAEWQMNVLLLHFADDHGLAVELPGFEQLAMEHAFTTAEVEALVNYAGGKGIDVIPELETFGHTRFLTDHAPYAHLYAGEKTTDVTFNALDPLNPKSLDVITQLLEAVSGLFPSAYVHVGCDEVDMKAYCQAKDLDEARTWVDYVNRVIEITHSMGKTPMMWADHPTANETIAHALRKDVILVDWRYEPAVKENVSRKLATYGFAGIVAAPSIACYGHRFYPGKRSMLNTQRMTRFARNHAYLGVINTVWCPFRYFQNALYYAIARTADQVAKGPNFDLKAFRCRFVRRMFDTPLTPGIERFLANWTNMDLDYILLHAVTKEEPDLSAEQRKQLDQVGMLGRRALAAGRQYTPKRNPQVFDSMMLAAEAALLCADYGGYRIDGCTADQARAFNQRLEDVKLRAAADWDHSRFADSPYKFTPQFPNDEMSYALLVLGKMTLPAYGTTM